MAAPRTGRTAQVGVDVEEHGSGDVPVEVVGSPGRTTQAEADIDHGRGIGLHKPARERWNVDQRHAVQSTPPVPLWRTGDSKEAVVMEGG